LAGRKGGERQRRGLCRGGGGGSRGDLRRRCRMKRERRRCSQWRSQLTKRPRAEHGGWARGGLQAPTAATGGGGTRCAQRGNRWRPVGAEGRGGGGGLQAPAAACGIRRRPARPTGAEAVEAGLHAGVDGLTRCGGRTAGGWRLRRAAVCRSSSLAPCALSDGRHPQSPPNRPC